MGTRIRHIAGLIAAGVFVLSGVVMVRGAEPSDLFGNPSDSDQEPPPQATSPWTPDSDATYHPDDVAALAEAEGLTVEDAELRMRLETAAMALQPTVSEQWPDTFGGMWLKAGGGAPGLVVAFTTEAETKLASLMADFAYPELISAVTVELSRADLQALQSKLIADRTQLLDGDQTDDVPQAIVDTGGSYTLGIRDSLNSVMVYLPEVTSELRDAFEQAYGHNVVLEERVIEPIACTINDCRYELRGGIKIQPAASTTAYCSSAFAAFSPNNYYLLSAAHCSGTQRYHAGEHFGRVTDEAFGGYVDVERLYRPVPSQWYVGAGIRIDGTDIRPIYYHITWANTAENTWIGKSGARTDTTRGYIIDKNISIPDIPGSSRFILAELCARPGDSGGSVFRNNTAYGIVSAGQEAPCNENSVMAFGNIVYALNAMQLQLLASP